MKFSLLSLLVAATLMSTVSASAYLEVTYQFWDSWATGFTNPETWVRYALMMMWYSFSPIFAPVIYQYVTNMFEGSATINVESVDIPLSEGAALLGLNSKIGAFQTFMSFLPEFLCQLINGFGIPCTHSFNATEQELCIQLGFCTDPNAP